MVFVPAARADNKLVDAMIEEHKLILNPSIIPLMFMWDPENHITCQVCQSVQATTHDVDQSMNNTLVVPTTVISNTKLNHFEAIYTGL